MISKNSLPLFSRTGFDKPLLLILIGVISIFAVLATVTLTTLNQDIRQRASSVYPICGPGSDGSCSNRSAGSACGTNNTGTCLNSDTDATCSCIQGTNPTPTKTPTPTPKVTRYACVNGQCVLNASGEFESIGICSDMCRQPTPTPKVTRYACVNGQCALSASGEFESLGVCSSSCFSGVGDSCTSHSQCTAGMRCNFSTNKCEVPVVTSYCSDSSTEHCLYGCTPTINGGTCKQCPASCTYGCTLGTTICKPAPTVAPPPTPSCQIGGTYSYNPVSNCCYGDEYLSNGRRVCKESQSGSGGQVALKTNGLTCATNSECQSGYCYASSANLPARCQASAPPTPVSTTTATCPDDRDGSGSRIVASCSCELHTGGRRFLSPGQTCQGTIDTISRVNNSSLTLAEYQQLVADINTPLTSLSPGSTRCPSSADHCFCQQTSGLTGQSGGFRSQVDGGESCSSNSQIVEVVQVGQPRLTLNAPIPQYVQPPPEYYLQEIARLLLPSPLDAFADLAPSLANSPIIGPLRYVDSLNIAVGSSGSAIERAFTGVSHYLGLTDVVDSSNRLFYQTGLSPEEATLYRANPFLRLGDAITVGSFAVDVAGTVVRPRFTTSVTSQGDDLTEEILTAAQRNNSRITQGIDDVTGAPCPLPAVQGVSTEGEGQVLGCTNIANEVIKAQDVQTVKNLVRSAGGISNLTDESLYAICKGSGCIHIRMELLQSEGAAQAFGDDVLSWLERENLETWTQMSLNSPGMSAEFRGYYTPVTLQELELYLSTNQSGVEWALETLLNEGRISQDQLNQYFRTYK